MAPRPRLLDVTALLGTPSHSPPGSHPLFGRPALALGARVLASPGHTNPRQVCFAVERAGLDDRSRRWLSENGAVLQDMGSAQVRIEMLPPVSCSAAPPIGDCLVAAYEAFQTPMPSVELMAILNVTPDSFSDGGDHWDCDVAIGAGLRFLQEGATWLDVGGESTRPGAQAVTEAEELARVLPVIEGLLAEGARKISIDTRHSTVAEAALAAGARMVNDVSAGLDDPRMLQVVANTNCNYVLMHRQGTSETMQDNPVYADVVSEVCAFLRQRAAACLAAGIQSSRLAVDPGLGFGKRLGDNLDLLRRLPELRSLGLPLLVGPSRKSFIAHVTGLQGESDWSRSQARDNPAERIGGTSAAITFCVTGGVKVVRVHDVAIMGEACAVASAIQARPACPESRPEESLC